MSFNMDTVLTDEIKQSSPASKIRYASAEETSRALSDENMQQIPLTEIERRVSNVIPQLKVRSDFMSALDRNGAGPENVARTIGIVMNEGDTHGIRLRAAEIAMRSMGLFENQNVSQGAVTFQIQGDNINLQAILQPTRESKESQIHE